MTSLINFAAINQNFPVAGQDNDTQVFRDNFDTIKTNFSAAKTEIEDLQDNVARTDVASDFNYNIATAITLQDAYFRKKDYGSPIVLSTQDVSFKEAMYHIIKFGNNCAIEFKEFPTAAVVAGLGQVGKATLELYGDGPGTPRTITFTLTGSTVLKKSAGFPGSLVLTSATNPVIIEVWQHSTDIIFLNYLGTYS